MPVENLSALSLTKVFEIRDKEFAEFQPMQMRSNECYGFYNTEHNVVALVCRKPHTWIISVVKA